MECECVLEPAIELVVRNRDRPSIRYASATVHERCSRCPVLGGPGIELELEPGNCRMLGYDGYIG